MIGRISKILKDPAYAMCEVRARVNRPGLFRKYAALSRRAGIDGLYFILSFDCDIDEDIEVVESVHKRLAGIGVTPVYAVSGPLLNKGEKIFRGFHDAGAEFINHGSSPHTFFDNHAGRHASCFFYDRLSSKEVIKDIEDGYSLSRDILGAAPSGFRAPHFGTFQKPKQLALIHDTLKKLGCRFSSSAMPYYGFTRGAAFNYGGIVEFPVSGMWSRPLSVLDSWEFYRAPGRTHNEQDYAKEGLAVARFFRDNNLPGILNYYADPCHIAGSDIFFDTVAEWAHIAKNTTYSDIMKKTGL